VVVSIGGAAPIAPPNVQAVVDAASASIPSSQTTPTAQSTVFAPAAPQEVVATAPAAPATQSNAAVQVDKDGLPYDARMHSTPATMTDKGFWRKKRGLADATYAQVKVELLAIAAIPSPTTAAPVDVLEQPNTANASEYAHTKAIELCGPMPFDDTTLQRLLNGHPTTLDPQQSNWYVSYSAARNKAYQEAIAKPAQMKWEDVGNPGTLVSTTVFTNDGSAPVVTPAAPAAIAAPPAPAPVVDVPAAPVAPQAPQAPAAPAAPAGSPFVTPDAAGTSFPLMMRWIVQNKVAGRLTDSMVAEVCAMFGFAGSDGVGSIAMTAQRADFWPHIVGTLQGYGAI